MNAASNPITLRGHIVHQQRPAGWITYAGPYRPATEDWMLLRAVNDARAVPGFKFLLCVEKAPERDGGFIGIALCRQSPEILQPQNQRPKPDAEPDTPPTQSSASSRPSPQVAQSKKPAK